MKSNASKSLSGLSRFSSISKREFAGKKEAIGCRSLGLDFFARNGHGEKVVLKMLLSEDDQEKCVFYQRSKILRGMNSKHIVNFNPLTPGAFCQRCVILDIFVVLRLDVDQISVNVDENAFAT